MPVRDGDLETLPVDDLPPRGSSRRARPSLPRPNPRTVRAVALVVAVGVVSALLVAAGGLIVSHLRGATSDALPGAPRRIALWTGDGRLDVVDRLTGAHRTIARDSPARPGTASLAVSPDGRTVFFDRLATSFATECGSAFANAEEVVSVPVRGGPVHLYGRGEFPAVSPDGRWLAFATRTDGSCAPAQNVVAFVELGVQPSPIYRAPLVVESPLPGTQRTRISHLSWDPDSQSVLVAGSFAVSDSPLVVDISAAITKAGVTAQPVPILNTGRTAYRGTRREFFGIEGNSVAVDEGDARAPQSLFTLSGLQTAATDASGRYFVAIDGSGRVFGWKPGLEWARRFGSLEGASANWIPDRDSTRLPTVDLSFTGSMNDAMQIVNGYCVTPRDRVAVGVRGEVHHYSCTGTRAAALRRDLEALVRRHADRVKVGDRLADLYALALGEPVDHRRRESIEWMAVVRPDGLCSRVRSRSAIRRLVPRARDETPEHWTLVEALPIGAACPQHLDDLYVAVRAAGYPDAANAVRDRMRRLLAEIDATYP